MLLGLGLIRDDMEKQTKDSVQLYTFIYTEAARSHYGLQKYTVNQHFWGYVWKIKTQGHRLINRYNCMHISVSLHVTKNCKPNILHHVVFPWKLVIIHILLKPAYKCQNLWFQFISQRQKLLGGYVAFSITQQLEWFPASIQCRYRMFTKAILRFHQVQRKSSVFMKVTSAKYLVRLYKCCISHSKVYMATCNPQL